MSGDFGSLRRGRHRHFIRGNPAGTAPYTGSREAFADTLAESQRGLPRPELHRDFKATNRGVAQPGRAPGSGPGGRRFESSLPDQSKAYLLKWLQVASSRLLFLRLADCRFQPFSHPLVSERFPRSNLLGVLQALLRCQVRNAECLAGHAIQYHPIKPK
jgi:hypothetical protein